MKRFIVSAVMLLAVAVVLVSNVRKEEREFTKIAASIEREVCVLRQIAAIDSQITAVEDRLVQLTGSPELAIPIYRAHVRHSQSPDLIMAVISTESSYRNNAVSEVGAQGLMQLMPATAELFLPMLGKKDYDPFNPEDNIDLGTFYLSYAMQQYDGDMSLALADYFGGAKGARSYRQKDWDKIPKTAQYVKKVSKSYWAMNMM